MAGNEGIINSNRSVNSKLSLTGIGQFWKVDLSIQLEVLPSSESGSMRPEAAAWRSPAIRLRSCLSPEAELVMSRMAAGEAAAMEDWTAATAAAACCK